MSLEKKKITETWYKYDDKGNVIHEKSTDPDGYDISWIITYDKKGNIIKRESNSGDINTYTYDVNNKRIYWKHSYPDPADYINGGFEEWTEYDKNGNINYQKWLDSFGPSETSYKYDKNNKCIYEKTIETSIGE